MPPGNGSNLAISCEKSSEARPFLPVAPEPGFHDLRREAGSRWIDGGMVLHEVSDFLRHTKTSQTDKHTSGPMRIVFTKSPVANPTKGGGDVQTAAAVARGLPILFNASLNSCNKIVRTDRFAKDAGRSDYGCHSELPRTCTHVVAGSRAVRSCSDPRSRWYVETPAGTEAYRRWRGERRVGGATSRQPLQSRLT